MITTAMTTNPRRHCSTSKRQMALPSHCSKRILDDPILQRDVALTERRVAWVLQLREETDAAREHWERSLDRLRKISLTEPDSIRRRWDVSWGCYHYGWFLLVYTDEDLGPRLLVESVELMTFVCVSSPAEATYRDDLAQLVPTVHGGLIEAGHTERAVAVLDSTLLTLQPAVESMPENLALVKVHSILLELRTGTGSQ